jgi:hypothetical protein
MAAEVTAVGAWAVADVAAEVVAGVAREGAYMGKTPYQASLDMRTCLHNLELSISAVCAVR